MARSFDPGKSVYTLCVGKKGSGKSHLAYTMWDSYPFDRLVLDVTHDVKSKWLDPLGIEYREITPETIPVRWPTPVREDHPYSTLVYTPDMGSPTAVDDLDRALGLALSKKRVLAWVDEIGELTSGNSTPPNLKRALHHGRHQDLSLIMCGPRPIDINPLCVSQSDYVASFRLRNPADRKRIADNIGVEPREFDAANAQLRDHWYLWYDDSTADLSMMPPLPPIRQKPVYEEVPE